MSSPTSAPNEPNHRARAEHGRLEIPVIDISGFESGDAAARREIARQVDRAARDVGFMQIVGHGIAQSAIDDLASAIDEFFALPATQKNQSRAPYPHINRGYNGPKTERLSYSLGVASAADLFEAFHEDPSLMGAAWNESCAQEEPHRSRHIADYIAGMTDRFAERAHRAVCGKKLDGLIP